MHDRVFDAADVLIYRQPVIRAFIDQIIRTGRGIARVIPTRFHESIEGIGFALGGAAALRTCRLAPFRIRLDGRIRSGEGNVFRQHDRQLFFRHRNRLTVRAVNHRNRATPITLAAHAPIAQTEIHATVALRHFFENPGHFVESILEVQSIYGTGIHHTHIGIRFIRIPVLPVIRVICFVGNGNDLLHRQGIFVREFEIALIVSGHCHQGTGAVIHQHEVGHPDRYFFTADRMNRKQACRTTFFLLRFQIGFGNTAVPAFFNERCQCRIRFCRLQCQWVLGCNRNIGHAHQGIGTRGKYSQRFGAINIELDFQAFAATDPVALHGLDRIRPTFQRVQTVQ